MGHCTKSLGSNQGCWTCVTAMLLTVSLYCHCITPAPVFEILYRNPYSFFWQLLGDETKVDDSAFCFNMLHVL